MEIEKKFLLPEFPQALIVEGKLVIRSEQRIEQTYLAMDDQQELRVRRIQDIRSGETSHTHTFKNGNGLVREEVEYGISGEIYEQIIKAFNYIPLTKTRLTGEWDGMVVEIDCYDQIQLAVLEVEFQSLEEATAFSGPAWFGLDISSQKQYSNKTVWKQLQSQTFN